MSGFYSRIGDTPTILIALAVILLSGFLVTRLTSRIKLPHISGYIIAGVLIGPYVLKLVPQTLIDGMGFMSDIALAFIAFNIGGFFKREALKGAAAKSLVITLFESLLAGIVVSLSMRFVFGLGWDFSLLLGAIATATAPASIMMTINQYHARGEFVDTLVEVVAFDDAVCLLAFSVAAAVSSAGESGDAGWGGALMSVGYNIAALGLGAACGFLLCKTITPNRSRDSRLIITAALLILVSGLCAIVKISPLISCMAMGCAYVNFSGDKALYEQLNGFTPPIMAIFFIVSGMNLNLVALGTVGLIGVGYFIIRIAGKYFGAFFGCVSTGASKPVRDYLGIALIPQAGVAINLAFLGQRILSPETGNLLLTIILSSSALYELIGPACAKAALCLSGAIKKKA